MHPSTNDRAEASLQQHELRPAAARSQGLGKSGPCLAELTTQRRSWLLAQARLMCRNDNDAEDLVQETLLRFIQAFAQVETLPSSRLCEGWLVTTLTHLFYDQCRKKKVQEQRHREPNASDEALAAPEPDAVPVYDTITDEQFAQALHTLSPKLQATLELHAAGKKYHEIARLLGIQMGTVAKRLHDARAQLRKLFQPHAGSGGN
jgi:RNA polymerase sigma-70 factor (ECF subfamily)